MPNDCNIESVSTKVEDGYLVVMCEPKRWRAEKNGRYWFVSFDGIVFWENDLYNSRSNGRYKYFNYFSTQEQAEKVAKEIREVFEKHKND